LIFDLDPLLEKIFPCACFEGELPNKNKEKNKLSSDIRYQFLI